MALPRNLPTDDAANGVSPTMVLTTTTTKRLIPVPCAALGTETPRPGAAIAARRPGVPMHPNPPAPAAERTGCARAAGRSGRDAPTATPSCPLATQTNAQLSPSGLKRSVRPDHHRPTCLRRHHLRPRQHQLNPLSPRLHRLMREARRQIPPNNLPSNNNNPAKRGTMGRRRRRTLGERMKA